MALPVKSGDSLRTGKPLRNQKPLQQWHAEFAYWLSHQTDTPSIDEQLQKAEELATKSVSRESLQRLKRRPKFREYFARLHGVAKDRARAQLEEGYSDAVHTHLWAIREAKALGDFKAIASLTNPIIDRVSPKREDTPAVTHLTIHLEPKQQAALTQIAEGHFEVLDAVALDE